MDDDLLCEYDSTWDTESDGDELEITARNKKTRPAFWSNPSSRNLRAAKDMQNYRHGYPNISEEECPDERMTNLKFYLNEIKSSDDVTIETFHTEWRTDYKRLERVHSYIQWLFPLQEPGVNYMAAELTKKEIQVSFVLLWFSESSMSWFAASLQNGSICRFSSDTNSYELMLGFYGIQLLNRESGEVKRADNWRERFANLERNMHNNLRITRILKSLGELGFEHLQAPLVRFFLEETLVRKTLNGVKRSVLDYFLFAVRDKRERRKLLRYAFQHFEPKDKFVWCPRKIQKRFKKKSEKRQNSLSSGRESAANDEPSQHKHKEPEAELKHSKLRDLTEDMKEMNSDAEMSSSKDQESAEEPHLSNGTSLNNGETIGDGPNTAEEKEGKLTDDLPGAEGVLGVSNINHKSVAGATESEEVGLQLENPLGPAEGMNQPMNMDSLMESERFPGRSGEMMPHENSGASQEESSRTEEMMRHEKIDGNQEEPSRTVQMMHHEKNDGNQEESSKTEERMPREKNDGNQEEPRRTVEMMPRENNDGNQVESSSTEEKALCEKKRENQKQADKPVEEEPMDTSSELQGDNRCPFLAS
ncbi:hypothetical protein DNTS_033806 [Danionella cerebrum]|uniref:Opioid growth factor receptor (OGFr) conserved domain-containing protein n=1 Tax=Danionella cerebrum TaxID=2873325 RepID=A0A553ML89_9TELE|nr:hypothetical protein DNTS_033806 [Danionella translucida]